MFISHCVKCGAENQCPPHYKGSSIKCCACGDHFDAMEDGERSFTFHCSACGGSIEAEAQMRGSQATCPHCSAEINVGDEAPPQVASDSLVKADPNSVTSVTTDQHGEEAKCVNKQGAKEKKISPAALIIITLLGVIIVGGGFVAYKQGVFTSPDPIAEAVNTPDYRKNFDEALSMMISNASIAESVSAGHRKMWQAVVNGGVRWSVDEAIQKSREIDADRIAQLREGKRSVSTTMSKLQRPPAEYAALYDKLITLFGRFNSFVDLAISPSGSYRSYGQSVVRLQEELVRGINEIQVMLPQ